MNRPEVGGDRTRSHIIRAPDTPTRTRWDWLLVDVALAVNLTDAVVMRRAGVGLLSVAAIHNAFPAVNLATIVGVLVGAVVLSRHPAHPIGWLFCWGQLGVALGLLARALADASAAGRLGAPVDAALADLLANLLGSMFALMLLGCLLLLVPDGRLLSRRWGAVLVLLALSYLLIATSLVLQEVAQGSTSADTVGGSAAVLRAGGEVGVILGLALSVVVLLLRLRRSAGDTRQQLCWVAVASAFLALAPVLALGLNLGGRPTPLWVLLLLHVGYLGVPVATGFAVLRYRLYDVDRIVAGSVVLAVLAVLAAGVYILALGLTGTLARGDRSTTWVSLLVFVVVALAFQPLRGPARRLADRVLHGRQAMSYEALHAFTHRLAHSPGSEPFLDGVAHAAGLLVGARECRAVLMLEDETEQAATWRRADPGGTTLWTVSIRDDVAALGRLELQLPDVAVGAGRRSQLLESFAERIAGGFAHARVEASLRLTAAQLEKLNVELSRSRARLLAAKDLGRRRVADRIQREVIGRLEPVPTGLARVAALARGDPRSAVTEVESASEAVAQAIEQLRAITSTVYSRRLSEQGLRAALAAEVWPAATVRVSGDVRWSAAVESSVYACCVDLIQPLSGQVTVELTELPAADSAHVVLVGADLPARPDWLDSCRERMEILGGTVERPAADRVVIRLPLMGATPAPGAERQKVSAAAHATDLAGRPATPD